MALDINIEREFLETHFEVCNALTLYVAKLERDGKTLECIKSVGCTSLYDLSICWAVEFDKLHNGREWDGEFFDEIDRFMQRKLSTLSVVKL